MVICCFIVARRLLLGFDDLITFSRGRSPFVMVAKLCFPSQYLSLDSCISANINIGVLTVVLTTRGTTGVVISDRKTTSLVKIII